jgi:hydroxymethylpyrimidine pyrophosphatase-like HAD family hydrolase
VSERHIYGRVGSGWHSLKDWNETCDLAHDALFERCRGLLTEIRTWVAANPGVDLLPDAADPEGIVTVDEATMDRAVVFLEKARRAYTDFSYQRNTVYLRFCHMDYHKGSALECLAKELNLSPAEILAAGDHHNDLSMLNPAVASMLACPGNAVQEVHSAVRAAGGFSSKHHFGQGTAEGIFHYL